MECSFTPFAAPQEIAMKSDKAENDLGRENISITSRFEVI